MAQKEREGKEDRLRELARIARDKRVGIHGVGEDRGDEEGLEREGEGEEGVEEARERDILRQERHKERERERRLARAHPDKRYNTCTRMSLCYMVLVHRVVMQRTCMYMYMYIYAVVGDGCICDC